MATLTLDIAQSSLLDPVEEARRDAPGDARRGAPKEACRDAPQQPRAERARRPRERAALIDGPTLDDVVARTWSALRVSRSASCLLCGGEVAPRYGSGPHPVGGACRSCGTEIS
jgi:hypothetical protein